MQGWKQNWQTDTDNPKNVLSRRKPIIGSASLPRFNTVINSIHTNTCIHLTLVGGDAGRVDYHAALALRVRLLLHHSEMISMPRMHVDDYGTC